MRIMATRYENLTHEEMLEFQRKRRVGIYYLCKYEWFRKLIGV